MTDGQLLRSLHAGEIFDRGSWDPKHVQQCSYILRMGHKYDEPVSGTSGESPDARRSTGVRGYQHVVTRVVADDQSVELKPGQMIMVHVDERFDMRGDLLALTVPRGALFAESLLVASSYVDPGFGRSEVFRIPITNVSDRIVHLQPGLPLLRMFVYRLSQSVSETYRPEQNSSLDEEVASSRIALPNEAELTKMADDGLLEAVKDRVSGGVVLAVAIDRLLSRQKAVEEASVAAIKNGTDIDKGLRRLTVWVKVLAVVSLILVVLVLLL
ncbi:dCTP deaminase domain-containing protein [Gordonia terrae]